MAKTASTATKSKTTSAPKASAGKAGKYKFRTKLEQAGKTATGFRVPPEVVEALGKGKKPPVRVTIKGYTYRNTVAVMGGEYWLGVSAEHREGSGVKGGEMIDVTLVLDDAPREIEVPEDLAAALKRDAKASKFFETLSYSKKRWFVDPIRQAKTEETRARRVAKAVEMLHAEKGP